jgi:hypothetical protein
MDEITYPVSICRDQAAGKVHQKHIIVGTWRQECPGVAGPAVEHDATDAHACTQCGHLKTGNVPGCTCIGCDDTCGKSLVEWPYGNCTERAGHSGDCDRPRRAPKPELNGQLLDRVLDAIEESTRQGHWDHTVWATLTDRSAYTPLAILCKGGVGCRQTAKRAEGAIMSRTADISDAINDTYAALAGVHRAVADTYTFDDREMLRTRVAELEMALSALAREAAGAVGYTVDDIRQYRTRVNCKADCMAGPHMWDNAGLLSNCPGTPLA